MNQRQRDLYEATLDSLTRHPEQWSRDAYTVVHPATDIYVWVANGHAGLGIGVQIGLSREEVVGGVTTGSVLFGPVIPWRRKIMHLAMAIANPEAVAHDDRVTNAILGLRA